MTTPASPEDPVLASIKANVVFEKMIVSVLTVAGASGAAHLLINAGAALAAGRLGAGEVGIALLNAATFTLLFFFIAFAAAVAVGVPLYLQMERMKIRKAWPYAAAAALVSVAVLTAVGAAPAFEAPERALYLVPGIAAALVFARKMTPFWRIAERMDNAPPSAVMRLH